MPAKVFRARDSRVAGGHTMMSASGTGPRVKRTFKALSSAKALPRPFIFQLPATSGLIPATSLPLASAGPSWQAGLEPPPRACAALPGLPLLPMMPPPRGVVQAIGLQRGFGKQE